jgi:hypothetical protein
MAVLLVSTPRIFQARAAERNGCQKDAAGRRWTALGNDKRRGGGVFGG